MATRERANATWWLLVLRVENHKKHKQRGSDDTSEVQRLRFAETGSRVPLSWSVYLPPSTERHVYFLQERRFEKSDASQEWDNQLFRCDKGTLGDLKVKRIHRFL